MRELVRDEIGHSIILAVEHEELGETGIGILAGLTAISERYPNIILKLLGETLDAKQIGILASAQRYLKGKDGQLILVTESNSTIDSLESDGRESYPIFNTIQAALAYLFGNLNE